MTVFDIPADRLSHLDDTGLRELVGRLCEAERERKGGHRTEVRWGGAQTAADGGLDVMVHVPGEFQATPVLPRSSVGIQVKKPDLSRSKILEEMCPAGTLRESIHDLARTGGAYVIVSVGADCSRSMLDARQQAMREAISALPNALALHTDFIDRHALARWVGSHPSVSLWLRARLGLPTLEGWDGYSRWSSTPEGIDDSLICKQGLSFKLPGPETFESVPEALGAIRTLVRSGTKAIRVAGLSGVGKTRLAQALFEQTGIGDPLPHSWAVYADLGRDPDPPPLTMLEILVGLHAPAVLIIDNCPPDTHRALAERLAKSYEGVRLITVEYDVRDDRPEETDVVRIESEGSQIVEVLIRRRHPSRSPEDARRLAELALGNARLALALAAAAPQTGSLSSFGDDALFRRLFWQRERPDPQFEQSAEALSLVYSFDAEGIEIPDELQFLSDLTGVPRLTLHRHATSLVDRGIAQVRGRWRAVLPHALANRLAHRAVRNLPWRDLATAFGNPEVTRLRRSFGRRLAYLHDLYEAKQIVLQWTQRDGPLDPARGFATYDLDLLERVCHLVPAEALDHLQHLVLTSQNSDLPLRIDRVTRLLARLAHTPEHFDHAVRTLVDLAVTNENREAANADQAIESLFGLFLSGTLARTGQRVEAARQAVLAQDPKVARRGLAMLRAALKTSMWSSSILSTDDARPDAFGWYPDGQEVVEWFRDWIALGDEAAHRADQDIRTKTREILATGASSVWRNVPPLRKDIETLAARLNNQEPWVEGWNALRRCRSLELRRSTDPEQIELERLSTLIQFLEPVGLLERARALLRSEGYFSEESESDDERDHGTVREVHSVRSREIGCELAERSDVIDALGPELFEARHHNPSEIGHGLGSTTADPMGHWCKLRDLFLAASERSRKTAVLSGFLAALDDRYPDLADEIRCQCLRTPDLRQTYATFAPKGRISEVELSRLILAARDPDVWAVQFSGFVWNEGYGLTDAQRVRLLSAMQVGGSGQEAVIDALAMLRHGEEQPPSDWPPELRGVGINTVAGILTRADDRLDDNLDYRAAEVVRKCLLQGDDIGARRLVDAVVAHSGRRYGSLYDVERTVAALAERSPMVFLDRALASEDSRLRLGRDATFDQSPLASVEPQALIDWCRMGGSERWIATAEAIQPFSPRNGPQAGVEANGLSAQALSLIETAPNPEAVVAVFAEHVAPTRWSGSRAAVMEQRLMALEQLACHSLNVVRQAVEQRAVVLRQKIAREHERERSENRERDVSFE